MENGVWVILWQYNDKALSGIGGVYSTLEIAKKHIKDLFDEGEKIEEYSTTRHGDGYIYYTNYATYGIEFRSITNE